ncbi:MAG: hypothetical protein GY794_00950, partial [bacterium]|nr:hypothetical protein [bacterium]
MHCTHRILLSVLIVMIIAVGTADSAPKTKASGAAATSEVKQGGDKPQKITANIAGFDSMTLTAEGYSWGQAVWGQALLIDAKGTQTRLADLKPVSTIVGWGRFSRKRGPNGRPLSIGGVKIAHGLFAHANSAVVYKLSGKFVRFEAQVGVNHTAGDRGKVVFKVYDSKLFKLTDAFKRPAAKAQCKTVEPNFSKTTLASLEAAVAKLIALGAGNTNAARKAQAEIQSCIKSFDNIRKALDAKEPDALKRTQALWAVVREVRIAELDAPLLFVKRNPYFAPHIYDDYLPYRPGGGIYVIENPTAPIDKQIVRAIIDPKTSETLGEGVYRDPDLSFDAKT